MSPRTAGNGLLLSSRRSSGFRPARRTARLALVGLLTSEPGGRPAFSLGRGGQAQQWPRRMGAPLPLGHSGGAIPDLHRSSLFVGRVRACGQPPTPDSTSSNVAGSLPRFKPGGAILTGRGRLRRRSPCPWGCVRLRAGPRQPGAARDQSGCTDSRRRPFRRVANGRARVWPLRRPWGASPRNGRHPAVGFTPTVPDTHQRRRPCRSRFDRHHRWCRCAALVAFGGTPFPFGVLAPPAASRSCDHVGPLPVLCGSFSFLREPWPLRRYPFGRKGCGQESRVRSGKGRAARPGLARDPRLPTALEPDGTAAARKTVSSGFDSHRRF